MHIKPPSAPSPPRRDRVAVPRRLATAVLLGLLAGAATALCLGTPAYRASAIVQVPDAGSSTRVALVNGAIVGAVSKPVIARAAASLNGAGVAIPPADLAERLALAVGVPGTRATAPGDRLIGALSSSLIARPGAVAGTVEIAATLPRAEQASLVATGIAEAFVAEQDEVAAQARHRDDLAAAARFEVLRAAAAAAHARLSALGGDGAEPGATRAATDAAATDLAAAIARRDAIARIIASGSPPLGEGKAMPAAVDALQTIYLDQIRQLAKARETLGDRHTTVISLNEAVQRATAALTSEWRRLKVAADADVSAAQAREGAARVGGAKVDGIREAALADARGAVRRADAALARADAATADVVEAQPYRVIVRASAPTAAVGVPPLARLPLALLAGLVTAALGMRITRRVPPPARAAIEPVGEPVFRAVPAPVAAPVASPAAEVVAEVPAEVVAEVPAEVVAEVASEVVSEVPAEVPSEVASEVPAEPAADPVITLDASLELAELQAAIAALSTPSERTLDMPFLPPAPQLRDQDALRQAMRDVLPELAAIEPRHDAPPTVMVAANEIGVTTMEAALALGHVAADAGYRVLVVEGGRPRAELAIAADPKVDPILVDMAGGLRVALRAEGGVGVLFLAPCFKDGPRIASALARGGETPFVDDVADEFDLVVIDGGRAADCALEDWDADLAVRVARFASKRDDERFVATLQLPADALLGTMAGSTFVPKAVPAPAATEAQVPEDQPVDLAEPAPRIGSVSGLQPARFHQPSHVPSSQARPSPLQAPHFAARRRVGLR